jgi:hypothetical protein
VETGSDGASGLGSPVAIPRGITCTFPAGLDLQDHQPAVAGIATVLQCDHGCSSHSPVLAYLIYLEKEGSIGTENNHSAEGWLKRAGKETKLN